VRDCTAEDIAQRYLRLRTADGRTISGAPIKGAVHYGEATDQECERLRLRPGTEVRRTTRMRALKGRPYAQELSVVPSALFRLPEAQQPADLSILELSRRCGVMILSGEERVKATIATRMLAASLGCLEGSALFEFDRVLLSLGGTPAVWEFGHWYLPGGYYLSRLGDPDYPSA
jgi:DNA-binding GntR family transcriptional regulator